MSVKFAINGFGRIGRLMFRRAFETGDIEIVAVNNLSDNKTLAHLLKYDSSYGVWPHEVKCEDENSITIDGKRVAYLQERDPEKLPWKELSVDVVLESTGVFDTVEGASKHLTAGAKKVIVTAVCKGTKNTYVMGVNDDQYKADEDIISNASCTTNCMAPVMKVLQDGLGVRRALMTTVHSYTNDQSIQDLPHKDLRRARAAAVNIIPTTTGAAKAVSMVIPELEGKMNGFAIRVPTPTVSLLDVTVEVEKPTTVEEVNALFQAAADGPMKGIVGYTTEELVSSDYKGDTHSAVVDGPSTMIIDKTLVKVVAWYDNEWGYSCRVIDLAKLVASKM